LFAVGFTCGWIIAGWLDAAGGRWTCVVFSIAFAACAVAQGLLFFGFAALVPELASLTLGGAVQAVARILTRKLVTASPCAPNKEKYD